MRRLVVLFLLSGLPLASGAAHAADPADIRVTQTDDYVQIDTDALQARINKKGYVSGVAAGTLLDKKTGARDVGFGLHIMDFLLAPGWADDGYPRDPKLHGNLPKHYVEGPQICTQAKELTPEIIEGKDFVAVRLSYRFTKPAPGFKAGSLWEQTLVFQPGLRYFLERRADHQRQRRGRPVLSHRHARPHPPQGRRHVHPGLPQLPRQADPGRGVRRGLRAGREIPLPAQRRQGPGAHDPGLSGEGGRQAGAVAGRADARSGGGVRGVVPPARLRLLHPGTAPAQGQGRRNASGPPTPSAISTTSRRWKRFATATRTPERWSSRTARFALE